MPSVLASVFGAKFGRTAEKDLVPVPDGFHRVTPELEAAVMAAVNPPTPERLAELLSRRPGSSPAPNFVDIRTVDEFFEKQKALYPDQYRDDLPPAPIATREQVLAAIAAKVGASPSASTPSTLPKDHPMSQHYVDQYAAHFKAMGRTADLTGVHTYAAEFAASAELQAEFKAVGGFPSYAAYRRATDQGRAWRVGEPRPQRR